MRPVWKGREPLDEFVIRAEEASGIFVPSRDLLCCYSYPSDLNLLSKNIKCNARSIRRDEGKTDGKPLPTELRTEIDLRDKLDLDDDNTAVPRTHADDEYHRAGEHDPKICLTTSRHASSKLVQFGKELSLIVPNAERINRGNMNLEELIESCRRHDYTDLMIVHERSGIPDGLVVSHLPYGPTAYFGVFNTVLRHDIGSKKEVGTASTVYPHLIFDNLSTALGQRFASILKYLFPVPPIESRRIVTFANRQEYISIRNHTYKQPKGAESIEIKEIGPRFELKPYKIKLGTVDQPHAETEWVLRSFIRSSKKPRLGDA